MSISKETDSILTRMGYGSEDEYARDFIAASSTDPWYRHILGILAEAQTGLEQTDISKQLATRLSQDPRSADSGSNIPKDLLSVTLDFFVKAEVLLKSADEKYSLTEPFSRNLMSPPQNPA